MIGAIIYAALFVAVAWQAYETYTSYRDAMGSRWERLKIAFDKSASIFWARMNALSVGAVTAVTEVSGWVGAPGVKEAILPYLTPEFMVGYLLFVAIGAEFARRRSL